MHPRSKIKSRPEGTKSLDHPCIISFREHGLRPTACRRRQPPALRTRPPRALGEPHPGLPYLYALILVAVAPWSHRTACSGEVSPSRAAMAAELRAPDLPKPNPHLRWTTRATSILHGQTPAQAEPCSPQDAFSGRAPPREQSSSDLPPPLPRANHVSRPILKQRPRLDP